MVISPKNHCANCSKLQQQLRTANEQIRQLQGQVTALQTKVAELKKDSTTSAKPPSSDLVKPPKRPPDPDQPQRSIGGQPGHPAHIRAPFATEELTLVEKHQLTVCPDCGQPLQATERPPQIVQQMDLQPLTFFIEEHQSYESWCPHCNKVFAAPLPGRIAHGGLLGPQLTALVAYLKGACHASFSTIRTFFRDVFKQPIARGYLSKVLGKVTEALKQPYEELLHLLPDEKIVNADETGHKLNGEQWWTWCFRAELYVLYHIDAHRSGDVLMDLLGQEFAGVLGCDCFSAYRRYMRECSITVQFCLAHLIRDIKFLTTLPNAAERSYGERLRERVRELFQIIHARDTLSAAEYQRRLQAKRAEIIAAGTQQVPAGKKSRALAKRLHDYGASYFTFITTPGMEPTNNIAEQAIRFVVIDRHITQGTRSEGGNRWSERIWTVIATCALQGQSVYEFLTASVQAYWSGEKGPSLLTAQV
jgi:transposase